MTVRLFAGKKRQSTIIVGCGRLGSILANRLSDESENVTIIDISENAFRKLSPSYGGYQIEGNGSDIDLLIYAGAKDADILIAATNSDDTNLMIAQFGKALFGIRHVIARIKDTSKLVALDGMDIDTICPAELSIREFSRIIGERTGESDENTARGGTSEDKLSH